MKTSSLVFTVTALIVVVSLLCIWFYPSIQDFMESNNMWNGIQAFVDEFGATNIDALDDLPDTEEGAVLIAIPYLQYNDAELSRIKRFVDQGGILLLMDDYGFGNSVLSTFSDDVRFSNKPLLDPLFCFKNQWLPRVTDFSSDIKSAGIEVLMLNHATALATTGEAHVIAWSSGASFLDVDGSESRSTDEPLGPFPIAAEFRSGKGTVFAISDPSILINTMVGRDNNYAFLGYLMSHNGEKKSIFIDRSHLNQTPIDVSKTRLAGLRRVLAGPYGQIGIIALIFVAVSGFTLKKGRLLV